MNYYNEHDPFAAAWLRKLIEADVISKGVVDERDIQSVQPDDLKGYAQCHFFAGIGVWSYALRQVGWPDDRPVWTGSCPCQPFSTAGKQEGFADPRHLWPEWFRLIRQCTPDTIFGEQVDKALAWFDLVSGDLESEAYTIGSAIMGAHSVGAPHIRQRLYFVANTEKCNRRLPVPEWRPLQDSVELSGRSEVIGLADSEQRATKRQRCNLGTASGSGSYQQPIRPSSFVNGFWADAEWLYCRDEKYRPIEPGTFPLAHGASNRVGRLRGYGNALCAETAKTFIRAYQEICSENEQLA